MKEQSNTNVTIIPLFVTMFLKSKITLELKHVICAGSELQQTCRKAHLRLPKASNSGKQREAAGKQPLGFPSLARAFWGRGKVGGRWSHGKGNQGRGRSLGLVIRPDLVPGFNSPNLGQCRHLRLVPAIFCRALHTTCTTNINSSRKVFP